MLFRLVLGLVSAAWLMAMPRRRVVDPQSPIYDPINVNPDDVAPSRELPPEGPPGFEGNWDETVHPDAPNPPSTDPPAPPTTPGPHLVTTREGRISLRIRELLHELRLLRMMQRAEHQGLPVRYAGSSDVARGSDTVADAGDPRLMSDSAEPA